jgi:NTE family protein
MNIAPGRRTVLFYLMLLIVMTVASGLWRPCHADAQDRASSPRPKIGVVFGGGGAKGAAHIGVLKVLEEQKVPVDYIAGTSMGAIVGALYASGLSADELEKVITAIDWEDVFSGDPDRRDIDYRRKREDYDNLSGVALGIKGGKVVMPKGLIKDQKVNVLFETLMLHTSDINDFDKLPIPYRAVAADLETGEMVVLKGGRLADAARASMSVPGAFPPIELDGRLLIDGGIVRNLPIDIVREMGAEIIICIDVDKPLPTREELGGSLSILNQMIDIMMKKNVSEQTRTLGPRDVYINPDLGELGSADFDKAAEIAGRGEKAAREKIESLKRYSVSEAEYAAFTARHHRDLVKEVRLHP